LWEGYRRLAIHWSRVMANSTSPYWALIGSLGRFQNPPADKHPADKPHPEAQSGHSGSSREPTVVLAFHLLPSAGPNAAEIPHHGRIGVKLDFVLEVIIGQRHECNAASVQDRLGHELIITREQECGHLPT
jgi:hypothetical protein